MDWVIPTPDKSNFTDSQESRLFTDEIKKYIFRHIPTKTDDALKDMQKSLRDLAPLFDEFFQDLGMLPPNMMPTTKTSNPDNFQQVGITEQKKKNQESHKDESQKEKITTQNSPRKRKTPQKCVWN